MSLFPIAEKQIALLGLLLFAWFVFSAATAMLLVALYLPGQGGLSAPAVFGSANRAAPFQF